VTRPVSRPPPSGIAALVLLTLLGSCRSGAPAAGADAQARPRVIVDGPSGRSSSVTVELARTPAEVERGLMFRDRLAPDAGMLFVFPETAEHPFWMKNTRIPLDMIFAAPDGTVVGVVESAEPLTTIPRTVGAPSRYVLEVNGGWSAAHGVARGDRLRFENVPDLR
jgi:uncharacterized protein